MNIWCGCYSEHACANQVVPSNGELACHHHQNGVECQPSCHRGYDFAIVPADKYYCDYDDGLWTPADRWPVRDCACKLKPNTHRRRRRDSTVQLSRVGGVYGIRNIVGDSFDKSEQICQRRVELRRVD